MKAPKAECIEVVNHTRIKLRQSRSKVYFNNPKRAAISLVTVDGCEINDHSRRCDNLIFTDSVAKFVELKGGDVSHAVSQLSDTLTYFQITKSESRQIQAIVVATQVRPALNTRIQILKVKFRKEFGAVLRVENSPFEDFIY